MNPTICHYISGDKELRAGARTRTGERVNPPREHVQDVSTHEAFSKLRDRVCSVNPDHSCLKVINDHMAKISASSFTVTPSEEPDPTIQRTQAGRVRVDKDGPLKDIPGIETSEEAIQYAISAQLSTLDLTGFYDVDDRKIKRLAKNLPNLERLLIDSYNITDNVGPDLEKLTNLQKLSLNGCIKVRDNIGPHLAKLTKLQKLSLSGCIKMRDNIGPHLAKLTNLQELDLSGCNRMTNEIGPHLVKLTNLQKLELKGHWQVTSEIRTHLVELQQLNINLNGNII